MPLIDLLEASAFGAALVFGFRHGFDWDHIAALTDLTGSQTSSRRSMALATIYALGHAAMVLVLGVLAILFAQKVPGSVDTAMERVVGVSLLSLGVWIAWTAITTRGTPPVRSRWMVLIDAGRGLLGRRPPRDEVVVIEHDHPHDHDHPLHEHSHGSGAAHPTVPAPIGTVVQHRHLHRHVAVAPPDPFVQYGRWSSFGIGLLHGVGAETPTQVLVFAAAAQATDRPTSVALLMCFLLGLLVSNTVVAAASTFGFLRVLGRPWVAGVLASVTAAFSLVVGTLLLVGAGSVLPPMLGG